MKQNYYKFNYQWQAMAGRRALVNPDMFGYVSITGAAQMTGANRHELLQFDPLAIDKEDILGINRNSLIEINGTTYNANEAGNFLWEMVIEYVGGRVSPNMIAELGTRGRNDESWEQKAITSGRNYALELLKRGDDFKGKSLFKESNLELEIKNIKDDI